VTSSEFRHNSKNVYAPYDRRQQKSKRTVTQEIRGSSFSPSLHTDIITVGDPDFMKVKIRIRKENVKRRYDFIFNQLYVGNFYHNAAARKKDTIVTSKRAL